MKYKKDIKQENQKDFEEWWDLVVNKDIYCDQCGEPIENGHEYAEVDLGCGYYVHLECIDEFFDELKENSVVMKTRIGKEYKK